MTLPAGREDEKLDARAVERRARELDPEAFEGWATKKAALRRVAAVIYAANEQRFPTGLINMDTP